MMPASRFALVLFPAVVAMIACSPIGAPKPAEEPNPLEGTEGKQVDTSHIGEPPPVKNQDAPDMDFLIDMAGRSGRQALKCDMPDIKGPRDTAVIDVTFEPSGWSGAVQVHKPHEGTAIGDCIQRAFEKVPVTAFKGSAVTLQQKIDFAKKAIEKASAPGAATPAPAPEDAKEKKGGGYY